MFGVVDFTKKEMEVFLMLVADGLTYKEISQKLHITEKTLKTHVQNIFYKTGISDRAKLIWSFYNEPREELSNISAD